MNTLNDYSPGREEEAADLSIYVVYSFESPAASGEIAWNVARRAAVRPTGKRNLRGEPL